MYIYIYRYAFKQEGGHGGVHDSDTHLDVSTIYGDPGHDDATLHSLESSSGSSNIHNFNNFSNSFNHHHTASGLGGQYIPNRIALITLITLITMSIICVNSAKLY